MKRNVTLSGDSIWLLVQFLNAAIKKNDQNQQIKSHHNVLQDVMCKQAMKKHSETQVTHVQPFHQQQQIQEKPEKERLQHVC